MIAGNEIFSVRIECHSVMCFIHCELLLCDEQLSPFNTEFFLRVAVPLVFIITLSYSTAGMGKEGRGR